MDSRSPYWRRTSSSGHAFGAEMCASLIREALLNVVAGEVPAMIAFSDGIDVPGRAFFAELKFAKSSCEHLRFADLVTVLMLCYYGVAGAPLRLSRSLEEGALFSSCSHRPGLRVVSA